MTESDLAGRWGAWLTAQLNARGWRQADLVKASDGHIKRDRVSKWVNGIERPTYRLAIVVANTINVAHDDALEAAGYIEPTPEVPEFMVAENEAKRAYEQTPEGAAALDLAYERHAYREALGNFHDPESRAIVLANVPYGELLAELGRRLAKSEGPTVDLDADVPTSRDDVALAAYDDADWQARQEAENE